MLEATLERIEIGPDNVVIGGKSGNALLDRGDRLAQCLKVCLRGVGGAILRGKTLFQHVEARCGSVVDCERLAVLQLHQL